MTSTSYFILQEEENEQDMHDDKTWKAEDERVMLRFMSEHLHPEPAAKCTADDRCDP